MKAKIQYIINSLRRVSPAAWGRLLALSVTLANIIAEASRSGSGRLYSAASAAAVIISAAAAYWKNNSFTAAAIAADETLEKLRNGKD